MLGLGNDESDHLFIYHCSFEYFFNFYHIKLLLLLSSSSLCYTRAKHILVRVVLVFNVLPINTAINGPECTSPEWWNSVKGAILKILIRDFPLPWKTVTHHLLTNKNIAIIIIIVTNGHMNQSLDSPTHAWNSTYNYLFQTYQVYPHVRNTF